MNPFHLTDLRRQLSDLSGGGVLVGIKTGTEAEDMSFEEIRFLRELTDGLLPLIVKIGGPEARNDIRELSHIGVDGIVAPMVESEYGLKKFVQAFSEILPEEQNRQMIKGLNMETIQGFENFGQILSSQAITKINRITAARSDLSESMGLPPDDPVVISICRKIIDQAREAGLETSLGGSVHPGNIEHILGEIRPDLVNTRNMLMNARELEDDPLVLLREFLAFEVALYKKLSEISSGKSETHKKRVTTLEKRLMSHP